ncbi:MAG: hypothetical protein NTU80_03080 [Verrucomicrobia bacterium]|nr:hypothetical protein [Verrucomicrobiota bacterium]
MKTKYLNCLVACLFMMLAFAARAGTNGVNSAYLSRPWINIYPSPANEEKYLVVLNPSLSLLNSSLNVKVAVEYLFVNNSQVASRLSKSVTFQVTYSTPSALRIERTTPDLTEKQVSDLSALGYRLKQRTVQLIDNPTYYRRGSDSSYIQSLNPDYYGVDSSGVYASSGSSPINKLSAVRRRFTWNGGGMCRSCKWDNGDK